MNRERVALDAGGLVFQSLGVGADRNGPEAGQVLSGLTVDPGLEEVLPLGVRPGRSPHLRRRIGYNSGEPCRARQNGPK